MDPTMSPNKPIHTPCDSNRCCPPQTDPFLSMRSRQRESESAFSRIDFTRTSLHHNRHQHGHGHHLEVSLFDKDFSIELPSSVLSKKAVLCSSSVASFALSCSLEDDDDGDADTADNVEHRVQFALEQTQVIPVRAVERKYYDQMYWTNTQLYQIHTDSRAVALQYRTDRPDYTAAIHRMLRSYRAASPTVGVTTATTTTTTTTKKMPPEEHTTAQDVIRVLMESPARGLESRIVPLLKAYRKRAVVVVLELQESLRLQGSDAEIARRLLRRKSLQASKGCRHFARQMAVGDQAVAQFDQHAAAARAAASTTVTPPVPSAWLQQSVAIVEP